MAKNEKGFEKKIESQYSGLGCSCQTGLLEKKESTLHEVKCKVCGKVFKTNKETQYCWKCENKKKR